MLQDRRGFWLPVWAFIVAVIYTVALGWVFIWDLANGLGK
jgi:hypothetical protein